MEIVPSLALREKDMSAISIRAISTRAISTDIESFSKLKIEGTISKYTMIS